MDFFGPVLPVAWRTSVLGFACKRTEFDLSSLAFEKCVGFAGLLIGALGEVGLLGAELAGVCFFSLVIAGFFVQPERLGTPAVDAERAE
jgi:hypothetical protein